jgi:hypothetical protein
LNGVRGGRSAATDRAILGRSAIMCLVVGAVLTFINHGDQLIRGEFDSSLLWKVPLTFLVPFLVATFFGAAAIRTRGDRELDTEAPTRP